MKRLFAYILAVLYASCDTADLQRDFEAQAFATPSGYTQTNDQGEAISIDADDWRTAPAYTGRIDVSPAFPNPPGSGTEVVVPFKVREFNSVRGGLDLVIFDANRIARRLDQVRSARDPGAYVFKFAPAFIGQTGLVRVYIVDPLGDLVSYGDLLLEE